MRALTLNATLKKSPSESNTEALARYVGDRLAEHGVEVEHLRLVDHRIEPGVVSEAVGPGDGWPAIHDKVLEADILVMATPTWLGQPSSVSKRPLERMDAMLPETREDGTPVAYNRVAGVIVTGNEEGAQHVIAEVSQALDDVGYTCPGRNWTYWNKGPGPGEEEYLTTEERDWTHSTGDAMASNLVLFGTHSHDDHLMGRLARPDAYVIRDRAPRVDDIAEARDLQPIQADGHTGDRHALLREGVLCCGDLEIPQPSWAGSLPADRATPDRLEAVIREQRRARVVPRHGAPTDAGGALRRLEVHDGNLERHP